MSATPLSIMGKHPGFGDFIAAGVSDPVKAGLQTWADTTLSQLRDMQGDSWQAFWDGAVTLRFWVGRALSGKTLAGVFVPSRDKVGRRYPLFVFAEGSGLSAPVIDADQGFYDLLETQLDGMQPGKGAASLLENLDDAVTAFPSEPEDAATLGPLIWAHHPSGDLSALLQAAGPVDQDRATTTRSYWWAPPRAEGLPAIWLGQTGMPDAAALGWLLSGQGDQPAPETEAREGLHA